MCLLLLWLVLVFSLFVLFFIFLSFSRRVFSFFLLSSSSIILFCYSSPQAIHFQTLPEQRTDELMKAMTTSSTPPRPLLSITDHRGNTPNLAASSTKHRAYANPLHPHVHHNILSSNGKKKKKWLCQFFRILFLVVNRDLFGTVLTQKTLVFLSFFSSISCTCVEFQILIRK